ncbi:WGR domain-containing protein [Mycolicibacterium sp.]|uniref:ATP-dependent DNA ligase n=1 Tax=Mycolicibacterium sp. TaxID=2320850 RepID=UPI0035602EDA
MTAIGEPKTASLYFRQGNSDKEYHARLESQDDGFVVNFAYGRRGSSLTTGTKTSSPVEYAKAVAIFDKLVQGKQSKGYTPGEDGTPYQHTSSDRQASGLLPQLLNVAEEADVARIVADPAWCMQEKFDGRRMMLRKSGDTVEAINKLGLVVGVSAAVARAAGSIDGDFILDGEVIGDVLYAFDIFEYAGNDLREKPYHERYRILLDLIALNLDDAIAPTHNWTSQCDKRRKLAELRDAKAEGVVFKRLDAPYSPGRPNSGGPQLKFKFVETLSALVTAVNTQRSVGLSLHGDDGLTFVGNVTIPANHDVPAIGEVVEVRYLYAAPALYQPVYLGVRDDILPAECVMAQVKFKSSHAGQHTASSA